MTGPLSGKTALVTGAGIRVGRAIAVGLAEAGADVAIHYRSSAAPAEETAAMIRRLGRRAETLPADLSEAAQCGKLARDAIAAFGGLDVLVHSAANFHRASLQETDAALWDDAMNVNARAAMLLAREAAPTLAQRRGRIVLISDLLATRPERNYLAHAASKATVEGLVRALAVELAPQVSVNGVSPGTVLVPEGTPEATAARWARQAPLQRNGVPSDVGAAVLFFCTGPDFITGQILSVDGGKSLT
jgi:NAD(P)-dependent dehydrogenase (short-subunit alcohol dehydrogenase family)